MVQRLKTTFNSLNRERLRAHFYNVAKVANAVGTGYLIAGRMGAVVSSIWMAGHFLDAKMKYDRQKDAVPYNTIGEISQSVSLGSKIKALKESFGIKEDMIILVTDGGSPAIAVGDPLQIIIPREALDGFSEDEMIAILKHEFAHQIMVSPYNALISRAGDKTAKYNMVLGGAWSLLSFNPLPVTAAYISRKTNSFLTSRQNIDLENAADAFAVRNGDGKVFFGAMQRMAYSQGGVILKALHKQAELAAQIPKKIRNFVNERIPDFVQQLRIKADYYLHATHPRDYNRLHDIAALVREQDPGFEFEPPQEKQVVKLCEGCMDQNTPEKRARLMPYLREAFRDTYGHENFEPEYFNCGRDERPRMPFPFAFPFPFAIPPEGVIITSDEEGGVIIVSGEVMGDLKDLDDIFGDEWPFPFPDPRKRGKGDPKPSDGNDKNGLFADLG